MSPLDELGVPVLPWKPAEGPPPDDVDTYLVTGDSGDGPVYAVAGDIDAALDLATRAAELLDGTVGAALGGESSRRKVYVVPVTVP